MKTFSINTLGCKVNQYESQQIRELLEKLGLQMADSPEDSDVVVVNTCCVTHTASSKSRQHIRRASKLNPDAVVVSGCLPIVEIGEFDLTADNIHLVRNRTDLTATLAHITGQIAAPAVSQSAQSCPANTIKSKFDHKSKRKKGLDGESALPALTSFRGQTRSFLKVQDGCDGPCTYCIVPKTRPNVRSKSLEQVLAEAQTLTQAGHREIVITGVFLGAYGLESVRRQNWPKRRNDRLAELLDKVAGLPGIERIRLSSLEPADVTPRLLETFCRHPNIMPHLHLSLQSGSDRILRRMRRQYGVAQFRQSVELLKTRLDRPAITTDIIVGFPGETGRDFDQTVELAREVGFAKMHVFGFSPRKGTPAARMKDAVDGATVKGRSRILRALGAELGLQYRRQFAGETARVLLETANGQVMGRSERYFKVYLKDRPKKVKENHLLRVKLLENYKDGMIGAAVS